MNQTKTKGKPGRPSKAALELEALRERVAAVEIPPRNGTAEEFARCLTKLQAAIVGGA